MLERIRHIRGQTLDLATYSDAFDTAYEKIVFWKLERRQAFREPGDPSWEAFAAGDWARSLKLNDAESESVSAKVDEEYGWASARGLLRLCGRCAACESPDGLYRSPTPAPAPA